MVALRVRADRARDGRPLIISFDQIWNTQPHQALHHLRAAGVIEGSSPRPLGGPPDSNGLAVSPLQSTSNRPTYYFLFLVSSVQHRKVPHNSCPLPKSVMSASKSIPSIFLIISRSCDATNTPQPVKVPLKSRRAESVTEYYYRTTNLASSEQPPLQVRLPSLSK